MTAKQFHDFLAEIQFKIFDLNYTINRNNTVKEFQDFPKDVQYNILKRLPVKSLIRFMCTSKSIYSIVTDPTFVDLWHTTSDMEYHIYSRCTFYDEQTFLLYKHLSGTGNAITYKKEFTNVPVGGSHYVIGSCHGLVCFANIFHHQGLTLIFWNPFLGKSLSIPITHLTANIRSRALGFGYDRRSLDFKVVRIGVLPNDSKHVWAEIYTLHSHTWKIVHGSISRPVSKIMEQGIFTNGVGVIHWIMEIKSTRKYKGQNTTEYVIVTYNLAKEAFGEIKVPKHIFHKYMYLTKLVISGEEKLAIYHNDRFCKLWVMEEYGESDSWKKIFGIDCGDANGKVLTSLANGNIVVSKSDGSSILYSPKNKSVRPYKKEFAMLDYVGPYVESLVFLGQQRLGGS